MSDSGNDLLMQQAIGELKEANKNIASSMEHIKDNLKVLNDNNVLHAEREQNNHRAIIEKLDKYWWLIVVLFIVILIIMGYKEAVQFVIP